METPVKVFKIKKDYGDFVAVKDISFGLEYGECFALLGVSGSGKTTCFKCLTGELSPSKGIMSIFGHDITSIKGFEKARKMIGYCP
jgi:ABC-type multidrug transport system ATPase subunit